MTPSTSAIAPASRPSLPIVGDELDAAALAVHRSLVELWRVVQLRDRDRICCHDVSVSQCHALQAIALRGPLRSNDLAAAMHLDKSTASRVVQGLEAKGHVARRIDPADGRAILLEATASGRALAATIEAELVAETRAVLAELDPALRRELPRIVTRLLRAQAGRLGVVCGCA